jgi:hypothetical protein
VAIFVQRVEDNVRHAGENQHPVIIAGAYGIRPSWIPACAGMATIEIDSYLTVP